MNKRTFAILLALGIVTNNQLVFAEYKSSVALRGAAFIPTGERFRDIYGSVMPNYQIEACTYLTRHFDGWLNADWFMKHGRSIGLHNPTRVHIANFSLGLKFPYKINDTATFYIGIGPSFGVIWLKNRSPYLHQSLVQPAFGGVLKSGVYCFLNKQLFLDFFADYLYEIAIFHKTRDISGVKVGAGIGSKF